MSRSAQHPLLRLLHEDPRYPLEAYQFVREALSFAQDVLNLGESRTPVEEGPQAGERERHLTGQQLCEASRQYAVEQYGLLARVVLKNLGIQSTSDIGEIVYNLIRAKLMKKSPSDRREDFDDVFDFQEAFHDDSIFSNPT